MPSYTKLTMGWIPTMDEEFFLAFLAALNQLGLIGEHEVSPPTRKYGVGTYVRYRAAYPLAMRLRRLPNIGTGMSRTFYHLYRGIARYYPMTEETAHNEADRELVRWAARRDEDPVACRRLLERLIQEEGQEALVLSNFCLHGSLGVLNLLFSLPENTSSIQKPFGNSTIAHGIAMVRACLEAGFNHGVGDRFFTPANYWEKGPARQSFAAYSSGQCACACQADLPCNPLRVAGMCGSAAEVKKEVPGVLVALRKQLWLPPDPDIPLLTEQEAKKHQQDMEDVLFDNP